MSTGNPISAQDLPDNGDAAELAIAQGLPIFSNSEPISAPNGGAVEPQPQPQPQPAEPTDPVEPTDPNGDDEPKDTQEPIEPADDLLDLSEPTAPTEPANDPFNEIYEKYGIETKGKEGIEKFIEAKNAEVETLRKQSEEVFADDSLKRANEIAKTLGKTEALEYLGLMNLDYNQVDNDTLLMFDLTSPDRKGLTQEQAEEYLESLPEVHKELQAKIVRNELIREQQSRVQSYEQEAKAFAEKRQKAISETLSQMKAVAGVKISNDDRNQIAKIVNSDELRNRYGLSIDSKADVKKAIEAAAILEMFPKVLKVAKQNYESRGKAQVLNNLSNVQPNSNPTPAAAGTRLSEGDQMIADLKQGTGLLSLI